MNELIAPLMFAAIMAAGAPLHSRPGLKRCCPQDHGPSVQVEVRRGERLPDADQLRMHVIENWAALGLRQPPSGCRWVHAGGRYALVAISNNRVRQVLSAR